MAIKWFLITASVNNALNTQTVIKNYYFKVDTVTNLVQALYKPGQWNNNILIPATSPLPSPIGNLPSSSTNPVNNLFFSTTKLFFNNNGVNIYDPEFATFLGTNTSYINFYNLLSLPYRLWVYRINQSGPNTDDSFDWINTNFITINEVSDPTCFKIDTKILSLKDNIEQYIPIQDLRKGDSVKTYKHGYKKIEIISKKDFTNPDHQHRMKDRLFLLSKDNYPALIEDLVITGCHSILVDSLTEEQRQSTITFLDQIYITDDKYRLMALCDEKCEPYLNTEPTFIYHLALENEDYYKNYGIYANGLLVETTSIRTLNEHKDMIRIE